MSNLDRKRCIPDFVVVATTFLLIMGCDKKSTRGKWLEGELYVQMVHHGTTLRGISLETKYFLMCRGIAYSLHFSSDCNFNNMEQLGESESGFIVPLNGKNIPLHNGARYRARGMVFDKEWSANGGLVRTLKGEPIPTVGPGFGPAKTLYVTDFELLSKVAPQRRGVTISN